MNDIAGSKGTLVTGVIGEDVHIMGIRIVENALRDAGFKIVSLGAQVSREQYIEAAIETNTDAILVSSLGSHASILVPGLPRITEIYGGTREIQKNTIAPSLITKFNKME